ncbi:MAG: AAA family ATPase [Gammaproteobacteria bacterium]|nr:AAA family ATPase [Gammaproteobacteria bacterium]
MYLKHFGLEHKPFTIAPDPRFLFLSERYREAFAHLLYGLGEGGGFVLLTGEVGTGKTTLCRALLDQLPDDVDAALLINPRLEAAELLAAVCDELGLEHPPGTASKPLLDRLNRHLLEAHAAGRRTVLIIDEAQLLGVDALESVRLLTNLETPSEKLLRLILVGQPELRGQLARPELRQLAQRITARYHLEPLDRREVEAYIDHRLRLAGDAGGLFTRAAKARIHRATGGIPRLVNSVCDRALLGAYATDARRVDGRLAARAAAEVTGGGASAPLRLAWSAVPLVAGVGLAGWIFAHQPVATAPLQLPAMTVIPGVEARAAPSVEPAREAAVTEVRETGARPVDDPLRGALFDERTSALERLASLWSTNGVDAVSPDCRVVPQQGLGCFDGQGAWAALRALDRPAVLALETAEGDARARYAVVASADAMTAELLAPDGSRHRVPRESLQDAWFGRFTLLWESPGVALLRPGDRGPAAAWLRARLGEPDAGTGVPARFDPALEARVLAFQ